MPKETKKYDKKWNIIYYKSIYGIEFWYKFDKNNRIIHYKNSIDDEYWYKWINDKKISISKEEFDHVIFLSRKKVPRYKILDI